MNKLINGLETDYLDGFHYKFTNIREDETGSFVRNVASKIGGAATTTIAVSQGAVTKALENSTLKTTQAKVSDSMVERYVQMIQDGNTASPIKVTVEGVIVDGNHRYVAGQLTGVEPEIIPGTMSPSQTSKVVPIQETKVSSIDWGGK